MTERLAASFRDPAGFMFRRDGTVFRQVNRIGQGYLDALTDSGLYEDLAGRLLIPHELTADEPADPSTASSVILPEQLPFVSYPYEWCPGQLRDAALATLEIQKAAVARGLSLRDASAYNIQFVRGRPILIDTLSFEPLSADQPWVAYGQFCRHFLAPLALMTRVDERLGHLLRTEIDGVPLDLASSLLPGRTRFTVGLGMHIHAHAKSQIKHADLSANGGTSRRAKFSERAMLGLVESLETAVRKLTWDPPKSAWRDYYEARESYSSAAISAKETIVAGILAGHQSDLILDLGANTGRFSRIAAETGATVVAIEMDLAAVEMNYREHGDDSSSAVLPLWMDLANPSPAQGWAHAERSSLEERGPADVVLALALIHHLAIGNNVPFTSLLAWFARLGRRVIVEWIPKSDPMVLRLLATREDIFADYSEPAFVRAFEPYFECESVTDVPDSERRVYVLARRPTDGS